MRTVAALSAVSGLLALFACSSPVPESGFNKDGSSSGDNLTGGASSGGNFSSGGTSGGTSGTSGGATCAGSKAETAKPKVDIIFVIDDSGSMTGEMAQIKTNVNTFATKIGGFNLDYTVQFITQRASSPTQSGNVICVGAPLGGTNCADNPPLFHHLNVNIDSHDSLAMILSTYSQWSANLREDAIKAFIEVTDDESTTSADTFETGLFGKGTMFGTAAARKYIFHSIISKPAGTASTAPNFSSAKCPTSAGTSIKYQDLSIRTGGIMDEVCKTDYSGVLDNIAKGIGAKLGCEMGYPTGANADPDKVVVTFTPGSSPTQTLTQVTDSGKCGSVANAWYYDNDAAPTKIILCPSFCTTVQATSNAKIETVVGCKGAAPS